MYISTISGHSGRGTGSTPMTVKSLFLELCVVKAGHSKPKDVLNFSFLNFYQSTVYKEKNLSVRTDYCSFNQLSCYPVLQ
jgi:hypothetical protein